MNDDCDALARHVDEQGRETVVHCSLKAHEAALVHWDRRLEVAWYSLEESRLS